MRLAHAVAAFVGLPFSASIASRIALSSSRRSFLVDGLAHERAHGLRSTRCDLLFLQALDVCRHASGQPWRRLAYFHPTASEGHVQAPALAKNAFVAGHQVKSIAVSPSAAAASHSGHERVHLDGGLPSKLVESGFAFSLLDLAACGAVPFGSHHCVRSLVSR